MSDEPVRVSDAEHYAAVAQLREHLADGRLSLEEFTERMSTAYAATTTSDLELPLRDLPVPTRGIRRGDHKELTSSDEVVRISDSDRERAVASLRELLVQGRLSLEEFTQRMESAYGATTSTDLAVLQRDLPPAPPEPQRSALSHLVAVFGSAKRRQPAGAATPHVDLTGLALFGSKETRGKAGTLRRGAPLVRVNAFVLFGSPEVRVKAPQ